MCGPADFGALHTCIVHLAELSAAGVATYSVCTTASLCRKLRPRPRRPHERALRTIPGRLAAEASSAPNP